MSVHDYLIDHSGFDWAHLLSGWERLLPPEFTVWLMNKYGDLFLILPDGSVHMLDIGDGSLTKLAEIQRRLRRKIDEDDNAEDWLMIPLVDRLVAAGVLLKPGECYSFLTPPILGGEYTVENTVVLPIKEHYGLYGSYHEQLRGVPDGTKVVIKFRSPRFRSEITARSTPGLSQQSSVARWRMKESGEILQIILGSIASIDRRPMMHGTNAGEIDTLLWHYHALCIEIMERDFGEYRSAVSLIHGRGHSCNTSFEGHYRRHTKKGAQVNEEEVLQYVIKMWKRMDQKLGIEIPET